MLGPIFIREWLILPRRSRHYFTRTLYLGGLWILLLTIWQTAVGWEYAATLGDLARFGLIAFQILAHVQLTSCCSSPRWPRRARSRLKRIAAPFCCCS